MSLKTAVGSVSRRSGGRDSITTPAGLCLHWSGDNGRRESDARIHLFLRDAAAFLVYCSGLLASGGKATIVTNNLVTYENALPIGEKLHHIRHLHILWHHWFISQLWLVFGGGRLALWFPPNPRGSFWWGSPDWRLAPPCPLQVQLSSALVSRRCF